MSGAAETSLREAASLAEDADWTGPTVRYDLVKEFVVALVVVALLAVLLAVVFSSPDEPPITIRQWATADPGDFLATALTELNGTSPTATYGPPYNSTPGAGQKIGPVSLPRITGVHIPINPAQDFVLGPLERQAQVSPALGREVADFDAAPSATQTSWENRYNTALSKVTGSTPASFAITVRRAGPVPAMFSALLGLADSGALDADLTSSATFYGTDYTKPLLFLADGSYLANKASAQHLSGTQWGMMNETGSYPGQAWLWLYTFWYQISPFNTSSNADALIWGIMAILTLLLILVPFIPGLRDIPRLVPVYRLVWRDHYRRLAAEESRRV